MLVLMTFWNVSSGCGTKRRASGDAGIGEYDVELAELFGRLFDRRFRRRDVGGVGDDRERVRPQFLRGRFQRRLIASGDGDPGALLHEQRAVVRPMPLLPPVINAVLFASLMIISFEWLHY